MSQTASARVTSMRYNKDVIWAHDAIIMSHNSGTQGRYLLKPRISKMISSLLNHLVSFVIIILLELFLQEVVVSFSLIQRIFFKR